MLCRCCFFLGGCAIGFYLTPKLWPRRIVPAMAGRRLKGGRPVNLKDITLAIFYGALDVGRKSYLGRRGNGAGRASFRVSPDRACIEVLASIPGRLSRTFLLTSRDFSTHPPLLTVLKMHKIPKHNNAVIKYPGQMHMNPCMT